MLSNSGINKVFLVGHISQEPQWNTVGKEPKTLCFSLVTTEQIKKNGVTIEHVEQHQIKVAEGHNDIDIKLKKGQFIYVQGKIQTRQFIDEHNVKRYKTEVQAYNVQVLSNAIEEQIAEV